MLSRRIFASAVFAFACLVFLSRPAAADDTSNMLQGVRWAGPAVTLDGLKGKTVVVLDYATWCPICNKWSLDLCKQLKAAVTNRPVVVLAIDTDEEPRDFLKKYLSKELDRVRELAKGELDEQFSAYDRAVAMVGRFKSAAQAKDARKVAASLESDAKFKARTGRQEGLREVYAVVRRLQAQGHGHEDAGQALCWHAIRREGENCRRRGRVTRGLREGAELRDRSGMSVWYNWRMDSQSVTITLPEPGLIKSCLISAIGLDLKEKNCCASFCEVIPDRTPRSEGCNSGVIMVEVWIAVQVPFIRHCQKLFSGACPLAREVQGST